MSDTQKYWTYGEAKARVREDLDLQEEDPDEEFITSSMMIGFFNEAIDFAEGEVTKIDEDYFLAYDFVELESGEDTYDMPRNILGRKFRGITYSNGTTRYRVKKYRRKDKFENILADEVTANSNSTYMYYLLNNSPEQGTKFVLIPTPQETSSTRMKRWFLRQANRVPLPGDFVNPEVIAAASFVAATDRITVNPNVTYVTEDEVQFDEGSDLPAELTAGTSYFVIVIDDTTIKLATTAENADAGTAIAFSAVASGTATMRVAATETIIDATVLDIPEFHLFIMEWVKANCILEDGDPRLVSLVSKLETLKDQIVETLTDSEPDDDNTMEGDFSAYEEMS